MRPGARERHQRSPARTTMMAYGLRTFFRRAWPPRPRVPAISRPRTPAPPRPRAPHQHARAALKARQHIEEEILQLKCPRASCRAAFYDFEGCFAISCGSCKCHFCGWCLADCGDSSRLAHLHVRSCRSKPPGADMFFGSLHDFRAAHTRRCRDAVAAYLAVLGDELRGRVEADMRQQLHDLDL